MPVWPKNVPVVGGGGGWVVGGGWLDIYIYMYINIYIYLLHLYIYRLILKSISINIYIYLSLASLAGIVVRGAPCQAELRAGAGRRSCQGLGHLTGVQLLQGRVREEDATVPRARRPSMAGALRTAVADSLPTGGQCWAER